MNSKQTNCINKETFERLFLLHCENLCKSAYKLVGDEHIAEDIVQDFFYVFWKNHRLKQFHHSFFSYAQKAVRNRALDYLEKKRIKTEIDMHTGCDNIIDDCEESRNLAARRETLYEQMEKGLNNLPENRKRIFLLSNNKNFTYKQIADLLNVSVNTVKTQIKLAYKQLRTNSFLLIMTISILLFLNNDFDWIL